MQAETPTGVQSRSSLAFVGFASVSLATAMAFLGARWTAVRGMIVCNWGTAPCGFGLPNTSAALLACSLLVGSVGFGILVAARKEIRRAKPQLSGTNLVRFGFVVAVVGMLANCYMLLEAMNAGLNTM